MLLCRLDLNSFLNAHDFCHSWAMTMRDRLRIDLEWALKPGLVVFLKATLWIFPHFSIRIISARGSAVEERRSPF